MIVTFTIVIAISSSILNRNFHDWYNILAEEEKEEISSDTKAPLNLVNYLWISKIMNQKSQQETPTAEEMLEWILTGQIDAIRK